jgi:1-aminocyclopropane-1-carboxylate deaminase
VIRGEEHLPLNPTLAYAVDRGMHLTYIDRTTYRYKDDPAFADRLHQQFREFYLLPEGGTNVQALRGCAELPAEIPIGFDVICCATGTGGTLAGIATALGRGQYALGFSVLKGGSFLGEEVHRLQHAYGHVTENWSIETEFHFGGYARRKPELDRFIDDFRQRHGVTLDWVYEAKMMYGIYKLTELGRFHPGTVLVAVVA